LGLGDSGLAMARYLSSRGYAVRVADTRSEPPRLAGLRTELPLAEFIAGDFSPALLDDVQLLALSPGLSPTRSPATPLVKAAGKRKIEVVGEIELFARELTRLKAERGYAPQIIGVTGTNGKTTTTRLTGLMIEAARKRVKVAGNITPPALDALRARAIENDLPDVWVIELSSFQLATTRSLRCDVAAVLNIADNHLDWHGSLDDYSSAKARIFGSKTVRVLNRDDARVAAMAKSNTEVVTFGSGAPTTSNSYGIVDDHGVAWLAWAEELATSSRRKKAGDESAPPPELFMHRLMPVDALAIHGRHNALNALAAIALARAIGCDLARMMHALSHYRGEPHRLQLIATIDGVQFYDDSKGTTVAATAAALEGVGVKGRKLVVILGGDGKGQDFAPLAPPMAQHARAAVLIGRDAPQIRAVLERDASNVRLFDARTLERAVSIAMDKAREGDAVLLSPACASLDMFRNYGHRGEVFAQAVHQLSMAGQPC
ncbi:MAG: UDP-N-acetylmuramoyl-L-alanine--D-glutamate ligase, partial [Burkholderiaceae bacterium]